MTTHRRPTRAQLTLINSCESDAIRLAEADLAQALEARDVPGIAPYAPEFLMAAFHNLPSTAWELLASLTDRQRVNQAIETTCYLETAGIDVRWADVLNSWEKQLRAKGLLGGDAAGVGVVPTPPQPSGPAAAQAEAWACDRCGSNDTCFASVAQPAVCFDCATAPTLAALGDSAQLVAAAAVPAEAFDEPRWALLPSGDGVERLTETESTRGVIVSHEELLRRLRLKAEALDGFAWPVVA